jgi:hypothetical protein
MPASASLEAKLDLVSLDYSHPPVTRVVMVVNHHWGMIGSLHCVPSSVFILKALVEDLKF